jgi:hypothetical protein
MYFSFDGVAGLCELTIKLLCTQRKRSSGFFLRILAFIMASRLSTSCKVVHSVHCADLMKKSLLRNRIYHGAHPKSSQTANSFNSWYLFPYLVVLDKG